MLYVEPNSHTLTSKILLDFGKESKETLQDWLKAGVNKSAAIFTDEKFLGIEHRYDFGKGFSALTKSISYGNRPSFPYKIGYKNQQQERTLSIAETIRSLHPVAKQLDDIHQNHQLVAFDLDINYLFRNEQHQKTEILGAWWIPSDERDGSITITIPLQSYAKQVYPQTRPSTWSLYNKPAANIYAFGIIVYQLLCGRLPWKKGQNNSVNPNEMSLIQEQKQKYPQPFASACI